MLWVLQFIEDSFTPGDHSFFLKKNEKFLSRKNIIKMIHFIPIFFLQKMTYFSINFSMGKISNLSARKNFVKRMLHFYVKKYYVFSASYMEHSEAHFGPKVRIFIDYPTNCHLRYPNRDLIYYLLPMLWIIPETVSPRLEVSFEEALWGSAIYRWGYDDVRKEPEI